MEKCPGCLNGEPGREETYQLLIVLLQLKTLVLLQANQALVLLQLNQALVLRLADMIELLQVLFGWGRRPNARAKRSSPLSWLA